MSYKRHRYDQIRAKKLYKTFHSRCYSCPADERLSVETGKVYYCRLFRNQKSVKYFKHLSNKRVRRAKSVGQYAGFRKVDDLWGTYY